MYLAYISSISVAYANKIIGNPSSPLSKGNCTLIHNKTFLGSADVSVGSLGGNLDDCYNMCMGSEECDSFTYTPEFHACQLWNANKTKSTSLDSIPVKSGSYLYRACKPESTSSIARPAMSDACACTNTEGAQGCKKHNANDQFEWCYVSIRCDLDEWTYENDKLSFKSGQSNQYSDLFQWRQCVGKDEPLPEKFSMEHCKIISMTSNGAIRKNNEVCDDKLNIEVCNWDGGDCCEKNGVEPNTDKCENLNKCVCFDPAQGGYGRDAVVGCQNIKACNYDQKFNTGKDSMFCEFREPGLDCDGNPDCDNGDTNSRDSQGNDCSHYTNHPEDCEEYDTIDFVSKTCCGCFVCESVNRPDKLDKFKKGCGDYRSDPEQYCGFTFRDSDTLKNKDCCACMNFVSEWRNPSSETKQNAKEIDVSSPMSDMILSCLVVLSINLNL